MSTPHFLYRRADRRGHQSIDMGHPKTLQDGLPKRGKRRGGPEALGENNIVRTTLADMVILFVGFIASYSARLNFRPTLQAPFQSQFFWANQ
jgi:hypothetical protein